ncbi:hypothetical protein [Agrobacterium tumefaciens]|uniref:hypothetical protein n=1 Tax=Agrobacterium tumefaciens TaxID=358 RepID=UPI00047053CE
MAIEVYGWEYEESDETPVARLHAKARYGMSEVLIPLDAVYVAGDAPIEEMRASADACRRLAEALLEYAASVEADSN